MDRQTFDEFEDEDVLAHFGEGEIEKARPYVDLVRDLEVLPNVLKGVIPGSAKRPYVAIARLVPISKTQRMLVTSCSCPVGSDCKHAAAMLLRAVEERKSAQDRVRPGVLSWVEDLRRASIAVAKKKTRSSSATRLQLFYILHLAPSGQGCGIELRKGKYPEGAEEWWKVDRALVTPPQFVTEEDLGILRLLWAERNHDSGLRAFGIGPKHGAEILRRAAATHRLYAAGDLSMPLQAGETRPASVGWQVDARGLQRPALKPEPPVSHILAVDPPGYLDFVSGEVGELAVTGKPEVVKRLFSLPPLTAKEAALVAEALSELAPELPLPAENAIDHLRLIDAPLVPVLVFETLHTHGHRAWRDYGQSITGGPVDVARVIFRYADADIRPDHRHEFVTLPEGETVRLARDSAGEKRMLHTLPGFGFEPVPPYTLHTFGSMPDGLLGLAGEAAWERLMAAGLPELRAAGWTIEFPDDFRHYLLEVDAWEADLIEGENGWFDLDMGIIVEGQRLALAPLLAELFRRDERWLDALHVVDFADDAPVELRTANGKRIRVPAGRLKPLALTLIDLFDGFAGGETLRISRFDAPRLAELNNMQRWQFKGQGDVIALAEKLLAAQGIREIEPPAGLQLDLRPYQREGLAWLQFLREHGLSGILADDMGLGKTAQTLAHLLLEKEAGRLDKPALIVLPTSLIFNWKNEAARFAPSLKVLSLHGPQRKALFPEIASHDVVLTTYPLLWRDAEELQQHTYHLLILDEAQTVKNAQSQSAEAVRKLNARHRL